MAATGDAATSSLATQLLNVKWGKQDVVIHVEAEETVQVSSLPSQIALMMLGLSLTPLRNTPCTPAGHQAQAGGGHQRGREAHEAAGPEDAQRQARR